MRNKICEELNTSDIGKSVDLWGRVDRRRHHGGVIFIDLRDQSGFLQLTFNPEDGDEIFKRAETLRNETVIRVSGIVSKRPIESINSNLSTGKLELNVKELIILIVAPIDPTNIIKSNLFQFSFRISLGFKTSIGSFIFLYFWEELPI